MWIESHVPNGRQNEHRLTPSCILSYLSSKCIGHGERGRNPAESVYNMRRNSTDDTRNGIANILSRCYDQRTCQQQHRCEHIVQPKDGVVSLNLLKLEIIL